MSSQKWGECFLESGVPLEHLALTTLTALGWSCEPAWEYRRPNRKGEPSRFEVSFIAHSPESTRGTLKLLTKCTYGDERHFWLFLPCPTADQLERYDAFSTGNDPEEDCKVLHYGPYVPLRYPERHTLIKLAPQSLWGVTMSLGGTKEENAIYHALEQLAFTYVPFCLDRLYDFCSNLPQAVVPVLLTTAKLFRLKPTIQRLEHIREANSPYDVAEEIPWTWCSYTSRGPMLDHNNDEIESWRTRHKGLRWEGLDERLASLWTGMHWTVVANIGGLADATRSIHDTVMSLPKDFSQGKALAAAVSAQAAVRRKSVNFGKDAG